MKWNKMVRETMLAFKQNNPMEEVQLTWWSDKRCLWRKRESTFIYTHGWTPTLKKKKGSYECHDFVILCHKSLYFYQALINFSIAGEPRIVFFHDILMSLQGTQIIYHREQACLASGEKSILKLLGDDWIFAFSLDVIFLLILVQKLKYKQNISKVNCVKGICPFKVSIWILLNVIVAYDRQFYTIKGIARKIGLILSSWRSGLLRAITGQSWPTLE